MLENWKRSEHLAGRRMKFRTTNRSKISPVKQIAMPLTKTSQFFPTEFALLSAEYFFPLVHQQYQCRTTLFRLHFCYIFFFFFCTFLRSNFLWGFGWLDLPAFICVKVAKFMLYGAEILIRKLANLALRASAGKSNAPSLSTSHVTARCECRWPWEAAAR